MKKNKTMRIASVLLIAVLLTTSIISGTFAKYVTADSAEDHARVAKFGVVVLGSGSLFDETYFAKDANTPGKVENGTYPDYEEDDKTVLTVESSNGDKLVAPGTENNDGMTFTVTGTPEVDVRINLDFDYIGDIFLKAGTLPDMTTGKVDDTFVNDADYYPIVYTLTGTYLKTRNADLTSAPIEGLTISADQMSVSGSLKAIKAVFDALNNAGEGIYVDANTDLATEIGTFKLTWKWEFEDTTSAESARAAAEVQVKVNWEGWNDIQAINNKYAKDFGREITDEDKDELIKWAGDRAAANVILARDQKDTLLGDLMAGTELTPETELEEGMEGDYNLSTSMTFSITVTQVD